MTWTGALMLTAYIASGNGLVEQPLGQDLADALWIDLLVPTPEQIARVAALGIDVPTLEDMEEIEISNRLYNEGDLSYMTGVFPGQLPDGANAAMPVCFILGPQRLVTVRHHSPRPFETYPMRANKSGAGCGTAERIFIGLCDEVVARLADLSEGVGKVIDQITSAVFSEPRPQPRLTRAQSRSTIGGKPAKTGDGPQYQELLRTIGRQAELMSRVRIGLLSVDRILSHYLATAIERGGRGKLSHLLNSIRRDIQALEVHADFLSSRIGLTVEATMGMISIQQNNTVRILSVVAALFLPPTLIASIYGMNFRIMPELEWAHGYGFALALMLASAVVTFLVLKWRRWF